MNRVKHYYCMLLIMGFLYGCFHKKEGKSVGEILEVNLSLNYNFDTYFDYRETQFLILTTKEIYPSYYKKKVRSFKNTKRFSNYIIGTENTFGRFYNREIFFKERYKRSDSLLENESDKMLKNLNKYEINIITKIEKGKQIVILDENNNQDFSDDTKLEFDNTFRYSHNNKKAIIDTLPILNLKYTTEVNHKKYTFQRKVQVYPYSNFFFTQYITDSLTKQTALMLKFKDCWKGKLNYKDKTFDIGVQGIGKFPRIMIKPHNVNYSENIKYNQNFEYRLKDTFSVEKSSYVIDSLSSNRSKLFIKKIALNREYFGRRIGNKIKDFKLYNLKEEPFKLFDVNFKNKKYTLIDVWGTWCLPCRKLTPELKRIHKKYRSKLNVLGVAVDDSIQKVKKYVFENQMKWTQAYIDRDKKSDFIKELKITSYPTFLLINKERKIIYRGSGEAALIEVERIVKNNKNTSREE